MSARGERSPRRGGGLVAVLARDTGLAHYATTCYAGKAREANEAELAEATYNSDRRRGHEERIRIARAFERLGAIEHGLLPASEAYDPVAE